jgi:hypothetical protein
MDKIMLGHRKKITCGRSAKQLCAAPCGLLPRGYRTGGSELRLKITCDR